MLGDQMSLDNLMFVLVNTQPVSKAGQARQHLEETTVESDVDVLHNFRSILYVVSLLIAVCTIP
jgi:hypothetical protein